MSLYNEAYALLFAGSSAVKDEYREVQRTARAEWDARIEAACAALPKPKGKRKKADKPELPEEFYTALRAELFAKYNVEPLAARVKALDETRRSFLHSLSDDVTFEPDPDCWHRVETCSDHSYSSQGWGAKKYAEGLLLPLKDKLESLGFQTHVRYVVTYVAERSSSYSGQKTEFGEYELWTDCPPWMADAVGKQMTVGDQLRSWKGRNINPHVYCPFLPHSVADTVPWGAAAFKKEPARV